MATSTDAPDTTCRTALDHVDRSYCSIADGTYGGTQKIRFINIIINHCITLTIRLSGGHQYKKDLEEIPGPFLSTYAKSIE
jgi:hypothetical protein